MTTSGRFTFTIRGDAAGKANSRDLVTNPKTKRPMFIKSEKARSFERIARLQIPSSAKRMLSGLVRVRIRIWYASHRQDLDESVVLDVMQARYSKRDRKGNRKLLQRGVYLNDKQVDVKHVYRYHDPNDPRVEITVWPLGFEQAELMLDPYVAYDTTTGEVVW